jgi:hypothetical protein
MQKRHKVTNGSDKLLLVFTELEAQDYWLKPGEAFEVVAEVQSPTDDFVVYETAEGYIFYPSDGMGYISVWQDGNKLACGHQRPDDWA